MLTDLEMFAVLHQRRSFALLDAVRTHQLRLHDAHEAARDGIRTLEGVRMRRQGRSLNDVFVFEQHLSPITFTVRTR